MLNLIDSLAELNNCRIRGFFQRPGATVLWESSCPEWMDP